MTTFLADTSVAVPLVMSSHEFHRPVSAATSGRTIGLAGHAQLETYSVLTRLPGDARLSPGDAGELLRDRFGPPIVLSARRRRTLLDVLVARGIAGGAAYDALIGLTAREAGSVLLTRDRRAVPTFAALGIDFELIGV